jgi:hypothetical protein
MANTPGSLLQSAARGIGAALPGFKAAEKERRAEEREIQKGLMDLEQGRNTVAAQKAMQLLEMQRTGIQGREGQIGREFQRGEAEATRGFQREQNALDRAVQMFGYSQRGSGGSGSGSDKKDLSDTQITERYKEADKEMKAALAQAKASDGKGTHQLTQRALENYGRARNARNYYARLAGLSEVQGSGPRLPKFEDYYKKNNRQLPIPRQPAKPAAAPRNKALDAALDQYG